VRELRLGRPANTGWYGAIAQLGERLLCKQEVVGSIPSGSTRRFRNRAPCEAQRAANLKLVRENNEFACSRFSRGLRVLSDIVKRRSIRVLRAAVKLRVARFLQAFLARMLPAAKVVRGVCAGNAFVGSA
jgi:hypothetical protein